MENPRDFYKDVPEGLSPSIEISTPNEEIIIHKGQFKIEQDTNSYIVDGIIKFCWFPERRTIFSGKAILDQAPNFDQLKPIRLIANNLKIGEGSVNFRSFGKTTYTEISGYCHSTILGDYSIAVHQIKFSIPNLRSLLGLLIKRTGPGDAIRGFDGRICFEDDNFSIVIDKVDEFDEKLKELKARGGFNILHGGQIVKKSGAIKLQEIKQIHFCISNFLYFINGRRTALYFMQGVYENETVWTDYTGYFVDQYKGVISWTDNQWINDVSTLWAKFTTYWKNDVDKNFLNTAIHWYVEANSNAGFVDGSIILAQTALELIYNWLIIEQNKLLTGSDAENISASNKIRLILSKINLSAAIPPSYSELSQFTVEIDMKVNDGPEVLTRVRNSLVHGQDKKRKDLTKLTPTATYQALQLALWYIELSLLYILDYKKGYHNRITHFSETVPWTNKTP